MKVLVLGGSGLLGHKLVQIFKSRFETCATLHGQSDKYQGLDIFDGAGDVSYAAVAETDQVLDHLMGRIAIGDFNNRQCGKFGDGDADENNRDIRVERVESILRQAAAKQQNTIDLP